MTCFPVIVDPVMISTSGHILLSEDAIDTLRDELLPLATVLTPNAPEAKLLARLGKDLKSEEDMLECATALGKLGPSWIYLKGGHIPLSNGEGSDDRFIVDMLYETATDTVTTFRKKHVNSRNTHGTGCTLSAAIASQMALGQSVPSAVQNASEYVRNAIVASYPVGQGAGPVNHLYSLTSRPVPSPTVFNPHPFTDYLIAQTGNLWERYVNHPFTIQLGKGTLPMKAFLYFITQDYSSLKHYARVNALAAYKAKTFDEMRGSMDIVQTVLHEVEMHIKVGRSMHGAGRLISHSSVRAKVSAKPTSKPPRSPCRISPTTATF